MSDENKFFRYVWRFNALALAALGIAGLFGILAIGVAQIGFERNWAPPGHFGVMPKDGEKGFAYALDSEPVRLAGTQEEVFVLQRWKAGEGRTKLRRVLEGSSRYSDFGFERANLLVVHADGGPSRWLFRDNDRAILSQDSVLVSEPVTGEPPPKAIGLVVKTAGIKIDENGTMTLEGPQALYIYHVGGTEAVPFFSADVILDSRQFGADRYVVIYENGASTKLATYSIPDFKLISEQPLPNMPK